MKQMSVTYKAPPGDNKVVEAFGHTFFDGKSEDVTVDDDIAEKLKNNTSFTCSEPTDVKSSDIQPPTEAEIKAKENEDKRKLEAQGASPPQRGAVLNKPAPEQPSPEPEWKPDDKEAGASSKGFHQPGTQAGRDK
jgi:hypothetical protein